MVNQIDFQTSPEAYRHWQIKVEGPGRLSDHGCG